MSKDSRSELLESNEIGGLSGGTAIFRWGYNFGSINEYARRASKR